MANFSAKFQESSMQFKGNFQEENKTFSASFGALMLAGSNIDPTLSQEGFAADAKAVGEALKSVVKSVNDEKPDENGNVEVDLLEIPMSELNLIFQ